MKLSMKLETGKYYKMKVTRRYNFTKESSSSLVLFQVEKILVNAPNLWDVWSDNRISIERNHKTDSKLIGLYSTGDNSYKLYPQNSQMYNYSELEEVTEEFFNMKVTHSKYGL
jgi:hypothetical protein